MHGRHSGIANTLWLDSHVKAFRPVISTVQTSATTPETYKANNIGNLISSSHPDDIDYYFELTKKN
jgi:prepilin-type processing-associated H-X9-DG protein